MKKTIKGLLTLLFILVFILLSSFLVFGALTDGLVSYWKMDSTTKTNDSFNNEPLTANGATWQSVKYKLGDGSYYFDGTNDQMDGWYATYMSGWSNWTFCTWTWFNSSVADSIFWGTEGLTHGFFGGRSTGKIQGRFELNTAEVGCSGNTDIGVGGWEYHCMRFNGTVLSCWKNTTQWGSAPGVPPSTADKFTFGTAFGFASWFKGFMDNPILWNRSLTDAELSSMYNSGSGYEPLLNPITNSSWNVTSNNTLGFGIVQDSTTWNTGGYSNISGNYISVSVTTNQNTNMSCAFGYDLNYTGQLAMSASYKATSTETTSHATTVYIPSVLPYDNSCLYCSFIRTDGTGEGQTSTSGCLRTYRIRPNVTFTGQNPTTLLLDNIIVNGMLSKYYNVSSRIPMSTNVTLYVKINSSTAGNQIIQVNGSCIVNLSSVGFPTIKRDLCNWIDYAYYSNLSGNYTFNLEDNELLGGTYNSFRYDAFAHSLQTLTATNSWVAQQFLNVSANSGYGFLEFDVKSVGGLPFQVWYCNSSWGVSNPVTSSYCAELGAFTFTGFNHSHNGVSDHNIFTFFGAGSVGSVGITSTSWFLIRGLNGETINTYYLPNATRANSAYYSTNGNTWTSKDWEFDAHLHQFLSNELVHYYACGEDVAKDGRCTNPANEAITGFDLPPTAPIIYYPNSTDTILGMSPVNWTNCTSIQNNPLRGYNVTIYFENLSLITILTNTSYLSTTFNTSLFADGNYYIGVECFDDHDLSAFALSELFNLNNTPVPIPPNMTGHYDPYLCPSSLNNVILLIGFIGLTLVIIWIGLRFRISIIGLFGAFLMFVNSWNISACNGMLGLIAMATGVIFMVFFGVSFFTKPRL